MGEEEEGEVWRRRREDGKMEGEKKEKMQGNTRKRK